MTFSSQCEEARNSRGISLGQTEFFPVGEVDDGQGLLLTCWGQPVKGKFEKTQQKDLLPAVWESGVQSFPRPWVG